MTDIENKNYARIKACIVNSIMNNPTFAKDQNSEPYRAIKILNDNKDKIPQLWQPYKEYEEEPKTPSEKDWDYDQFIRKTFYLTRNFNDKRIDELGKIGLSLAKQGKLPSFNTTLANYKKKLQQKLTINLAEKIANKIRDLLQKAIVTFRQVIAKNTPFVKKYHDILIKNSDKVNDLEISWVDIDGMFLISDHFQVVADPLYEKKINDALQDSSIDNFLSDLKGYKPKKKTIKIGDPKIGGIKNLLNMFDRLRFGTTGSWKVDEWRKKMNAASNAIASKKEKASASEAQESLLCQCYYLYARAMVNVQSALLIDCKNALLKAIGTVRNVKESMINLTIEVSTYDMNKAMNEIFIIESYGITEEFDSFMESRFSLPLLY